MSDSSDDDQKPAKKGESSIRWWCPKCKEEGQDKSYGCKKSLDRHLKSHEPRTEGYRCPASTDSKPCTHSVVKSREADMTSHLMKKHRDWNQKWTPGIPVMVTPAAQNRRGPSPAASGDSTGGGGRPGPTKKDDPGTGYPTDDQSCLRQQESGGGGRETGQATKESDTDQVAQAGRPHSHDASPGDPHTRTITAAIRPAGREPGPPPSPDGGQSARSPGGLINLGGHIPREPEEGGADRTPPGSPIWTGH